VAAIDPAVEKQRLAVAAGAEVALPFDNAGRALQKERGGVDAAIVFTAAPSAIPQAFRALKRGGTLVLVGLATAQYELPLVETVTRGISIRGSYLGTRQDLEDVFRLLQEGVLRPHTQTHGLAETPALLDQMRRGALLGRAVIAF
jgi:propanol-preferring alcohol dehydrogenase